MARLMCSPGPGSSSVCRACTLPPSRPPCLQVVYTFPGALRWLPWASWRLRRTQVAMQVFWTLSFFPEPSPLPRSRSSRCTLATLKYALHSSPFAQILVLYCTARLLPLIVYCTLGAFKDQPAASRMHLPHGQADTFANSLAPPLALVCLQRAHSIAVLLLWIAGGLGTALAALFGGPVLLRCGGLPAGQ